MKESRFTPTEAQKDQWKPYTEIREGRLFTMTGPDQKNLDNQERIRQANLRGHQSRVFRAKGKIG